MNQTRSFLLIAWLLLAFLVWEAWVRHGTGVDSTPTPTTAPASATDALIPQASPGVDASVPESIPEPVAANPATAPSEDAAPADPATRVVLANDVLRLELDGRGGGIARAELLAYRQTTDPDSTPVVLFDSDPRRLFVADWGLVSANGAAASPSHLDRFVLEAPPRAVVLDDDREAIQADFVWNDPASGLSVRRSYLLENGSYVLTVRERIDNAGSAPWAGNAYRQLRRVPPEIKGGGFTNPEAYSFIGAGWYSPEEKFEKLAFDDFETRDSLGRSITGGWLAMIQHYYMAALIPDAEEAARYSLLRLDEREPTYLTRVIGPVINLAPGAGSESTTRLWIGPKLQDVLPDVAPGLALTVNYGVFTVLSDPLYWLLSLLHSVFGNWGWAIVALVVIIKALFFKLSEAQYKSFAKLRAFQPRIEALKERYGDDKQKFQQAMMELYKKEKINPMGGCLPILIQIPVFIALYWVLLESVELRHAPWIGWIQNLTERDPYFVLPVLNALTMWYTQKLSPTPGMDPIQKKMLQIMPLAFGVMFAFFPAGLVLYWTTNGALGLLQQWVIIRRHGDKPGSSKPKAG